MPTFIAVRLPYTVQADEDDAQLALQFIRPDRQVTFNIQRAVEGVAAEYADALGEPACATSSRATSRRAPG